jgi:hypothetical protein
MEKYLLKFGQLSEWSVESDYDRENHIISGYIGDDNVDCVGHMIEREPYIEALRDYTANWGNIRDSHGAAVGQLIEWGNKGWNHIRVKIVDERVWNLIATGVYKGFSIGARAFEFEVVQAKTIPLEKFQNMTRTVFDAIQKVGEILVIKALEIIEISVTDRPANRAALFTKSIDISQINELPSIWDVSFKEINMENNESTTQIEDTVVNQDANQVETNVEQTTGQDSNTDIFDVEKVFALFKSEVEQRFETLSGQVNQYAEIAKGLTDAVESLQKSIESLTKTDTEQTQEQIPVVESPVTEVKSLDVDALVEKIVNTVVPKVVNEVKTVVANLSVERQNTVNRGESDSTEFNEEVFKTLSPGEKTKFIARQMANSIKG